MSDKLTSLKGFGEGDPKPEAKSKALSKRSGSDALSAYKEKKRENRLMRHTTLGMYDRDFRKPFNQHHAKAVNEVYKKKTGKELSNL